MHENSPTSQALPLGILGLWSRMRMVGPAIIIASVVLGPGSIVTNSKVGWKFGYSAIWVLVAASLLMMGMTALAMRVGVALRRSPCDELAANGRRWFAASIGIALFLVAASFQFSNNLGILFAFEPLLATSVSSVGNNLLNIGLLLSLNAFVIASLLLTRNIYRTVEAAMKWMVGLMLFAFAANLLIAQPSIKLMLLGLIPNPNAMQASLASDSTAASTPMGSQQLFMLLGLVATTFSVGAAFYQAYLVRQRGWGIADVQIGSTDAVVGIASLGGMSLMIMVTAAAAFYQNPDVDQLDTAADVARQLRPLFGPMSTVLFCLGVLAGALSSFLVNAMIGGCVLADGLGFGSDIEQRGPRIATVVSLLIGMVVAIATKSFGFNTGSLIVFAQAITVIGNPLLATAILVLAVRCRRIDKQFIPGWLLLVGYLGLVAVVLLSLRTIVGLVGG